MIQNLLVLTAQKSIQPLTNAAKCSRLKYRKKRTQTLYNIKNNLAEPENTQKQRKTSKSIHNPQMAPPVYHDYECGKRSYQTFRSIIRIDSFHELSNYLKKSLHRN